MTATPDQGLNLGAIRRRWIRSATADDYTDAGCRTLTEHAFRDVPALIAEVDLLIAEVNRLRRQTVDLRDELDTMRAERDEYRDDAGHDFVGHVTESIKREDAEAERDAARAALARVRHALDQAEGGEHATKSRDYGRGVAYLARLIRDALADPDSHTTKDTP